MALMGSGHKDHMNQAFGTDNCQSDAMDVGSNSSTFSQSVYTRSDFTNAPLKQTGSGVGFCRRMPCKARGVPGEHVASNAYIDIPVDAKHGTLLSCSHPSCRHSGRLFRFCSVCQVPVAKVGQCNCEWSNLCTSSIRTKENMLDSHL